MRLPYSHSFARGNRYILLAISLVLLVIILWRIRDVVVVSFGGIIGAIILRGLAEPLARHAKLSETWALTLTLIYCVAVLTGLSWFFGNQTANELGEMQRLIPEALAKLTSNLQRSSAGRVVLDAIKHASADTKFLAGMGTAAGAVLGGLTELSLVIFLSVYFAFNPKEYFEGFLRLIPPANRLRLRNALTDALAALHKWLAAQVCAMIIVGVLAGVSLAILQVPLAFLLGVFAGLLEFIPVVGPVLFTIPAVLVAFTQSPTTVLYVTLVYLGIQQLESNIITPMLQRKAVQLPPAVTLLSVVTGGLLLGPTGVIFGIPLAVVGLSLVKHLYVEGTLEKTPQYRMLPVFERVLQF